MKEALLHDLKSSREFFVRSTDCLVEEDSAFAPAEGMLSVCVQVAHVAQSCDWFIEGMTREEGFDLNFETHWVEVVKVKSLAEARSWFDRSFNNAIEALTKMSEEKLAQRLPESIVMGNEPRSNVIGGIVDHTAHHRGALTVYSRLLGKEPKMPYMDM